MNWNGKTQQAAQAWKEVTYMAAYSRLLKENISNFLDEDDWKYSFNEEMGVYEFNLVIEGRLKRISYTIYIGGNDFTVYAVSPLGADQHDETEMAQMAQFLCRANYGLRQGNFEMDCNDGEIRYKVFVSCDGITPSREMIRSAVYTPAAMFDRYSDGFLSIIFEGRSAKQAIALCEGSRRPPIPTPGDGSAAAQMLEALAEKLGMDPDELRDALEQDDSKKTYDA